MNKTVRPDINDPTVQQVGIQKTNVSNKLQLSARLNNPCSREAFAKELASPKLNSGKPN